ncbi:type VI secretion system Vgr family protein [Taylorella equigenitalis]|uniref:type VI secretion system Vgr family protein n=1 Tax=Taylorella equigenitalis TaxID=29575 RepID=UPI0023AF862B|nr:type VI secretion system tip protein TssI/VgrG [Taylorella equigenitalis]WED99906.1 type VI secretion system tip protein TssI/VgrG [Taylorella equigenitalis]WEE01384.1 type VI secretion system tip protein TssI/VgrG [Taylorella equigenitalis]WFD77921.1 type VI secretion system tip protein TssI/VgrG [Taylorella equigenitalis]WFD79399.1 type VI secretion system tip protein TssI/VgrG [Taylorella equigenitalis]WFD80875.1 type VI secretion system tip protein TssI/VgrG [Taylorella equigenitalis]
MSERHLVASTVYGDELKFKSLEGVEKLSDLFDYTVDLVSEKGNLDLEKILGTMIDITVDIDQGKRYFQGLVINAQYLEPLNTTKREHVYRFQLRPWLWLATQTQNNRIFQKISVPDIIEEVLEKYPFKHEFKTMDSYRTWPYCVQYGESDFAFISRLCEYEGIYYFFEHTDGEHKLIFTDCSAVHKDIAGESTLTYHAEDQVLPSHGPVITAWGNVDSLYSNEHTMVDYDFEKSKAKLDVSHSINKNNGRKMEIYDLLPGYIELEDGEKYVKVAAESQAWKARTVLVETNYPLVSCGSTFSVDRIQDAKNPYVILSTEFTLHENQYASAGGNAPELHHMHVKMHALPKEIQFRAPKITPIPKAQGPMTARVVGVQGEEIYTDKYGRIKVQFHWDRKGKSDDNSSCWLRVSSPWAGSGFGGVQIPRIGDEVIVGFVGAHIDRPMVIGRVYNANNMPALEFPANATQSGTVTRSKYGDSSTFNQMLMEDKPGDEKLSFQAQKDMDTLVKNNEDISVAGEQQGTHGGTTDLSVGGYDDNIFKDASTETNEANQVRTIIGTSDEIVEGPRSHSIGSNATINMGRGFVRNVDEGLATYTYGAGRNRTVNTDYTHSAKSTVKRTVSGGETYTVGSVYSKSVSGGPIEIQSGGLASIDVKGDTTISSKTDHENKAGSNMTVKSLIITHTSPCVTEDHTQKIDVALFKNTATVQSTNNINLGLSLTGLSEAAQVNKIGISGVKIAGLVNQCENSQLKGDITGIKLKKAFKKSSGDIVKNVIIGVVFKNP